MCKCSGIIYEYKNVKLSLDERRDSDLLVRILNNHANEGWRYRDSIGECKG